MPALPPLSGPGLSASMASPRVPGRLLSRCMALLHEFDHVQKLWAANPQSSMNKRCSAHGTYWAGRGPAPTGFSKGKGGGVEGQRVGSQLGGGGVCA